jgi:hypothetical protein
MIIIYDIVVKYMKKQKKYINSDFDRLFIDTIIIKFIFIIIIIIIMQFFIIFVIFLKI